MTRRSPASRTTTGSRGAVAVLVVAAAAATAAALAVLVAALGHSPTFDPVAVLGRPAPQVRLVAQDGAEFDLSSLRGKAVLVNFWNTWCGPCREEAPALAAFDLRHRGDADYAMVGIVRDDTRAAVRAWTRQHDLGWRVAFDVDDQAALDFGTTGQPETYAVSRSGQIVAKRAGPSTPDDLERLLALAREAA